MPIIENEDVDKIRSMSVLANEITQAVKNYETNPEPDEYNNILYLCRDFTDAMEMNDYYIQEALSPSRNAIATEAEDVLKHRTSSEWMTHGRDSYDPDDSEIDCYIQAKQLLDFNSVLLPTIQPTLEAINAAKLAEEQAQAAAKQAEENAKIAAKKLVGTLVNLTASKGAIERQFSKINDLKRELTSLEELEPFLKEFKKTLESYKKHIEDAKELMAIADQPNIHAASPKVIQQCKEHVKYYHDNEDGERLMRHASSLHRPLDETTTRNRTPGRDRE